MRRSTIQFSLGVLSALFLLGACGFGINHKCGSSDSKCFIPTGNPPVTDKGKRLVTNGPVDALAAYGDTLLLGGSFTYLSASSGSALRVDVDKKVADESSFLGVDGPV